MSCGTCGIQASETMQGDTGVPAGAPTSTPARCPHCKAFVAQVGAPCHNPRCSGGGKERPTMRPPTPRPPTPRRIRELERQRDRLQERMLHCPMDKFEAVRKLYFQAKKEAEEAQTARAQYDREHPRLLRLYRRLTRPHGLAAPEVWPAMEDQAIERCSDRQGDTAVAYYVAAAHVAGVQAGNVAEARRLLEKAAQVAHMYRVDEGEYLVALEQAQLALVNAPADVQAGTAACRALADALGKTREVDGPTWVTELRRATLAMHVRVAEAAETQGDYRTALHHRVRATDEALVLGPETQGPAFIFLLHTAEQAAYESFRRGAFGAAVAHLKLAEDAATDIAQRDLDPTGRNLRGAGWPQRRESRQALRHLATVAHEARVGVMRTVGTLRSQAPTAYALWPQLEREVHEALDGLGSIAAPDTAALQAAPATVSAVVGRFVRAVRHGIEGYAQGGMSEAALAVQEHLGAFRGGEIQSQAHNQPWPATAAGLVVEDLPPEVLGGGTDREQCLAHARRYVEEQGLLDPTGAIAADLAALLVVHNVTVAQGAEGGD